MPRAKKTTTTASPPRKVSTQVQPARYMGCPTANLIHPPLAIPVWKGPKAFFVRCGSCRSSAFLSPAWTADKGLTRKQAEQAGFIVAAI